MVRSGRPPDRRPDRSGVDQVTATLPTLDDLKAEAKVRATACAWVETNRDEEEIDRLAGIIRDALTMIDDGGFGQSVADVLRMVEHRPSRKRIHTVATFGADHDLDGVLKDIDEATRIQWCAPSLMRGGHELLIVTPSWPNSIRIDATREDRSC